MSNPVVEIKITRLNSGDWAAKATGIDGLFRAKTRKACLEEVIDILDKNATTDSYTIHVKTVSKLEI